MITAIIAITAAIPEVTVAITALVAAVTEEIAAVIVPTAENSYSSALIGGLESNYSDCVLMEENCGE